MKALRTVLSIFVVLAVAVAAAGAADPPSLRKVDLSGEWRYLPYDGLTPLGDPALDDSAWPVMDLPSNWFLMGSKEYPAKLKAARPPLVLPDPEKFTAPDKDLGLDYAGTMWFRRSFDWAGASGRPVILDLDMVDYYAEVFINGVSAAKHEGYFQRWSVDITPYLRAGKNAIALKVSAPRLIVDPGEQFPISWPKHQDEVKGIFLSHDTRPGATTFRGQERSTGGVIRGIALRESAGLDLVQVNVFPLDVTEKSARLVIEATVRNWTSAPIRAVVQGEITPKNFSGDTRLPVKFTLTAAPGESQARAEVQISQPALWWSWDYGKPNLYQLAATLAGSGGEPLDQRSVPFGIRSISHDEHWVWRLNGQRIYLRGSNYISTQWLSQADRAWYERDVKLMVGANLNAMRIHAHLERPEFYEATDEAGILVWQDFPLQWGYTDDPAFHREAVKQAGDMVARYGSHPSIIVWCMQNEAPHAMDWMKKKVQDQNLALDEKLFARVHQLDPSRVTHRDSGTGDAHPYPGWYGGTVADFASYKGQPLITEYGAQALPGLETLRATFDEKMLWPQSEMDWEAWRFANFQPESNFGDAQIEKGKSLEEFIEHSQRYQANLVRFATECFRRGKWTTTTGIYQFMFSEDWPSITWAVVDYYRRPKAGYAALRDSMQPLLPSIAYAVSDPAQPLSLYVINDYLRPFAKTRLKWRVVDASGRPGPEESRTLDIAADSVMKVVELGTLPEVTAGKAQLTVWLEGASGQVLGRNHLDATDFVLRRAAPQPHP
ncbi:MAG: hypothetical protein LAN84_16680 [Acidobacteriia bacterium]|nr:hypothetical protein [Terriglobia bacterium]